MSQDTKPDVAALMREIHQAAQQIEQEPPRRPRRRARQAAVPVPVPALEERWDAWRAEVPRSHRGWKGFPITLAKRLLLRAMAPYSRELLRQQRDYNWHLKEQVALLHAQVASLRSELAELQAERER